MTRVDEVTLRSHSLENPRTAGIMRQEEIFAWSCLFSKTRLQLAGSLNYQLLIARFAMQGHPIEKANYWFYFIF